MSAKLQLPEIPSPRYTAWAAGLLACGLSALWLGLFALTRFFM